MSWREVEAERNREDLAEFLRTKVIGDEFSFDDLENLRKYIDGNKDEEPSAALCDYLDLGNWFFETMDACDFDVEDFLSDLESDMQREHAEWSREQAEQQDDYYRMVGAK